ncbi:Receptor-like protein 12 [Morella rubra]|nr:Receptor-like protein 12 [Morella rubra]
MNQSNLLYLDLSNNQIEGEIPKWICKLPINVLNLSYNYLVTTEEYFCNSSSLLYLDLRSNQLQGPLQLVLRSRLEYLDLSMNNFSSTLPASIGNFLATAYFFSLSKNKLYGSIPMSMCNATNLEVLDLSGNFFSCSIPQCLIGMRNLKKLNLRRNNLTGTISATFTSQSYLRVLALNGNQFEGKLPKSLANCTDLLILDLGNNHIEDTFPCWLKSASGLRILILRFNKFYGPIGCPGPNATWPELQIIDLASNNFSGKIPTNWFPTWMAMIDPKVEIDYSPIINSFYLELPLKQRLGVSFVDFQDEINVLLKGHSMELGKIQTSFTWIDFSCNKFDGPIPEELGGLKSLYLLNLSHNAFTGPIPSSLGNLSKLESLDLSSNKLTGKIPQQLADGLIFLSVLNLSFNQLVENIPMVKQFFTFSETSYEGNKGLCGSPLKEKCGYQESGSLPPAFEGTHSNSRNAFNWNAVNWNYISVELGYFYGLAIVIGPLLFWRKWRIRYYTSIDDICFRIFPQCYLRREYRGRRVHKKYQGQRVIN